MLTVYFHYQTRILKKECSSADSLMSVVGKSTCSGFKTGLYISYHGGNAIRYIQQKGYFMRDARISGYFHTKYMTGSIFRISTPLFIYIYIYMYFNVRWYRKDALTYMFLNSWIMYILFQLLTHIYNLSEIRYIQINYWDIYFSRRPFGTTVLMPFCSILMLIIELCICTKIILYHYSIIYSLKSGVIILKPSLWLYFE